MRDETIYDAVIVGAGPAGAACAAALVAAGRSCVLVERKRLPRYKACGGLLSERSVGFLERRFGGLPAELLCPVPRMSTRISRSGERFVPTGGDDWLSVRRRELDAWLVERAGLTDVFVIGIEIRWINVNARPIAIGAKPAAARFAVAPRMMIRKNAVSTNSATNPETIEYPLGDRAP